MLALRWRLTVLLLAGLGLPACATWEATTVPAPRVIEEEHPSSVRLTLWSGEQVVLDEPEVRADSIVGDDGSTQARSVPFSTVQRVAVRRTNVAAAIITTVPLVLAAVVLVAVASCDIC